MKQSSFSTSFFALGLMVVGALTGFQGSANAAETDATGAGTITIISGDEGVNVIKRQTAVTPVVEVKSRDGKLLAGAIVTFTSPSMGPSVKFLSGGRSFTAVTEIDGRAKASGLIPVGVGSFQIEVTARFDTQLLASTRINQTNYETSSEAAHAKAANSGGAQAAVREPKIAGMSKTALTALIVAIAAGAGAGLAVGLNHGSNSTTSVGAGTPTAGAPH